MTNPVKADSGQTMTDGLDYCGQYYWWASSEAKGTQYYWPNDPDDWPLLIIGPDEPRQLVTMTGQWPIIVMTVLVIIIDCYYYCGIIDYWTDPLLDPLVDNPLTIDWRTRQTQPRRNDYCYWRTDLVSPMTVDNGQLLTRPRPSQTQWRQEDPAREKDGPVGIVIIDRPMTNDGPKLTTQANCDWRPNCVDGQ